MSNGALKVLRLTPFFHHEVGSDWPARFDPVGGQQIQCRTLSLGLAGMGVQERVLTLGFPGIPDQYTAAPGVEVFRARYWMPEIISRTTGLVGLTYNWARAARARVARFGRDGWQPDLAHIHGDGQIDALRLALWFKRHYRVPLVLTLHCSRIASYRPMNAYDSFFHNRVIRNEGLAVASVDAVVCLTDSTAAAIREAVPAADVRVFPDIVDDSFVRAGAARHSRALRAQPHTFAFVGRISHEKGWPALLDMLADPRLERWRLLVIGDGPERQAFEESAARRGLSSRITITGFQPRACVAKLLPRAEALVMPSLHEEFGGAAVEAMALGVPVVGYAVGGLIHSVGAIAPEILAPPGNVSGLIDRLLRLTSDPAQVALVRERGRHWVKRCAPSLVLPSILHLYQTLVHRIPQ